MSKKQVSVVVRSVPISTVRVAEALRMSVGLTLSGNAVRVVFAGDGVYALLPTAPETVGSQELAKPIETLLRLGHELVAERESLEAREIGPPAYEATQRTRAEIAVLLAESDVVIGW